MNEQDVERVAKEVYEAMRWAIIRAPYHDDTPPKWQDEGNSLAQGRARDAARNLISMPNKHEKAVKDAMRYQYLRNADVDAIHKGGIFAGKTPENVVINGEDLDEAIDKALATVDEMMGE